LCPFFSVGTNLSGRPHNPLRQSFAAFPCPHIGCRAGGHCALAYSAPLCLCVLLLAHPPTRSLRCLSSAILPAFEVCARRVTASPAHQIIESYLCRQGSAGGAAFAAVVTGPGRVLPPVWPPPDDPLARVPGPRTGWPPSARLPYAAGWPVWPSHCYLPPSS
jgi:hypothetical protein